MFHHATHLDPTPTFDRLLMEVCPETREVVRRLVGEDGR